MKNSSSENEHPLLWFLAFSIPFVLILAVLSSNASSFIICCSGLFVLIVYFMGWFLMQTGKAVATVGNNVESSLRRRKCYPAHEWTNAEMLNDEHPYLLGDDGELIELDADEKRKHDDSNP